MFMVYGAYGYTGRLVVDEAKARGLPVLLAGRDPARLRALSEASGYPWRAFPLDGVDLAGVEAVLHCAGPFVHTSRPMADACIAARVHYLDITGEIPVFEALAARDAEARTAGIVLLPGAGYDVVPSDCLLAHAARRLPGARRGWLALAAGGGLSRGTAHTAVGMAPDGVLRRHGALVTVPPFQLTRRVDFGDRLRTCATIPWGDVATGWWSTRIPDFEVYAAVPRTFLWLGRLVRPLMRTLRWGWLRRWLDRRIDAGPPGPPPEVRATGWGRMVVELEDAEGRRVVSRLYTPETYTLTARLAVRILERLSTLARPGFHTPSGLLGPDFILEFEGVERQDLA